tara:strand:- start:228 stop:557 length:330 start_codon:yes stop_codon:yes gene_type:complete
MIKKFLEIFVVVLLLSGSAYSETIEVLEESESATNFPKKLTAEKITNNWLKNKTVSDLRKLNFFFKKEFGISTLEDSIQYHLFKTFKDPFVVVYIICFIDPIKTNCRLA